MQIENWIDTELAKNIWTNKYQYKGETFDEWIDRISNGNENIKQLIIEKKFLFGGRILANRGLHKKGVRVTYSNCYVIPKVEDNIESIFDTAKLLARTFSYGGGCGVDITNLRPTNATVNNTARNTTGSVSFMDLYSLTTELIGQHGRRGALMLSILCTHPDLIRFIDVKNDLTKVTKANISIRILDDFMKAVKEDKEWTLYFYVPETDENITETHKAKELFNLMAKNNWNMAEPGMLFWDTICNWNLLSEDDEFEFAGTNPCFTADTKLLTDKGYIPIADLENAEFNIISKNGKYAKGKVWCSGEKDTIKVKLSNNQVIKCTPNHVFMLSDGTECEAKDLKRKRIMPFITAEIVENPLYVKLGFIQGDGCTGRINSEYHKGLEVNIGQNDGDIKELFKEELKNVTSVKSKPTVYYINGFNDILIKLGFDGAVLPERVFPITYTSWNANEKQNFLKGCYSANGSVITHHRVSYKTTSKVFALQLQKALNEFNITPNMTINKPKTVEFNNGAYLCKESYDICINKYEDILNFYKYIGFYQQYKQDNLIELIKERSPQVISITHNGIQKVYDFTEPETHWGVIEGFIAHNCAEEPLPAGGSCLLGSINLSEFVINPYKGNNAKFDYVGFKYAVEQSVIALNEVLDEGLPLHPLQIQRDSVRDWRQIGLGVMGIGDMLIKMSIKYGSEDSMELCDQIGFEMADTAINTSALLAKEHGAYPNFKLDKILKSPYLIANTTRATLENIKKYGLRNSQLLTIAPTGSLSTMIGISGGIEPLFAISYFRTTKSLHDSDVTYKVYTPIVKDIMDIHNIQEEKDLPDYIVTSMNLNYKDRIDMQSIWQNHIDASISSTVNVPESFTVAEVEDLYMYAWEKKLKGITIYRDNCARFGILTLDKKEEPQKESKENPLTKLEWGTTLESSDDLIGKKRKIMSGCGSLHVQAWFDPCDGRLMEIYLSKGSEGGCNSFMTALSRAISAGLRTGMSFEYAIDQLKSTPSCPSYSVRTATKHDTSKGNCCPSAVANALIEMQKEINYELGIEEIEESKPNKTKPAIAPKNKVKCPKCGGDLRFEGGCNSCPDCGYSRCD